MCTIDNAKLPQVVTHYLTLLSVFLPSIYLPVSIYLRQSDRCLSLLVALSFRKTSTMTRDMCYRQPEKEVHFSPRKDFILSKSVLWSYTGQRLEQYWSTPPPAVVASPTSSGHQRREYRSIVFPSPRRCYESTDLRRTLSRWTARGREELL